MRVRARTVTKLPASLSATGGLKVEKDGGVWTFSPEWTDLSLETTLPEPEARQLWVLNPNTGVYTRLSVQALIDNLPEGPAGDAGSLIFVQNSSPSNDKPEGSLWIDSDSADLDLYQLTSGSWGDTGTNLKGDTGDSPSLFVQNDAPATSYLEGSLWIDADSGTNDLYQLQSGVWVDTGVNLKGADGTGTGDVSHGSADSVDNEIVLFSGTSGKIIKRATTTGVLKASSGVIAEAVAGTDYLAPSDIGVTVQPYDADTAKTDVAQTWTAIQTFNEILSLIGAADRVSVSGTGLSGTLNFDQKSYAVYFSTANATGNWTLNVRGDGSTTLNSRLQVNDAIVIHVISTQGGTAYYQSVMQIDSASVTPKWVGGAPSAGTPNSIELYQHTIVKTANETFTVISQKIAFT